MNAVQLLESVIGALNENAELFAKVKLDRLDTEGISAELIGGKNESEYLSGGALQTLPVLFLSKSAEQRNAFVSLYKIYSYLTGSKPAALVFTRLDSSPSLVDSGENAYVYEMQLTFGFFAE